MIQNEIGTRIAQSKFAKISNRLSQEPLNLRFYKGCTLKLLLLLVLILHKLHTYDMHKLHTLKD
jgi:hypothetical protein